MQGQCKVVTNGKNVVLKIANFHCNGEAHRSFSRNFDNSHGNVQYETFQPSRGNFVLKNR